MRAFVMPDHDFDTSTKEGRLEVRKAVEKATRKVSPTLMVPLGGAKGGIGRGRILHRGIVHNVK